MGAMKLTMAFSVEGAQINLIQVLVSVDDKKVLFTCNLSFKMGQRNMVYTGPITDNEIEHAHLHPEPCAIPYNQIATFPLPADHLPPPGITFMAAPPPQAARVIPIPVPVPVLHNQLTFPSNHGFHGPFKGKINEVFPVNFQYFYPSPTSNPFMVPDYNVTPVIMGPAHHRGPITHAVVPGPWLEQPFCNNPPGVPFIPGYANRAPVTFVHPPVPAHQQPPLMPPLRATMDFHPLQNGVEFVPRFVGPTPTPPFGVRVFPPHQLESTSRPRGFPHLRVLPEDLVVAVLRCLILILDVELIIIEICVWTLIICHMRQELLALGEQIGNAGSGLSEDFIAGYLKTRVFSSSKLEVVSSVDQELSFCTICQMEYNDEERVGMLDCSHGYHVDCIKKWLTVKNTCPICKCTGLTAQGRDSGNLENS
ncbi:hypothetical protein LXL04_039562 [Taraxacum kok-saghyz]